MLLQVSYLVVCMVPVIGNLGTVTLIWVLNNHAKMPDLITGTSTLTIFGNFNAY